MVGLVGWLAGWLQAIDGGLDTDICSITRSKIWPARGVAVKTPASSADPQTE